MGKLFRTNLVIVLLILAFTSLYYPVSGAGYSGSLSHFIDFSPNQVLVKFSEEVSIKLMNHLVRQAGGKVIHEIPSIGALILEVSSGEVDATIAELKKQEGVIYAEPNYYVEATDITPNDPEWGNQYNLAAIRAPAGWQLNTGAVWVTIAIIDSGVDLSHPDLFVRILPGYDFVNNDNDPQDDNGHGTHVAAIAAASSNNAVGIAGVNWGANILPIKVLNASGNGTYANVAAGIVWATDNGAQIINLSLGGGAPSFVLSDAVDYAYNHGVILVASTGNAGAPAVLYPAAFDAVIAVGATDMTNAWAGFSNYGPEVDVVAPGVNIYSAYPDGGYGYRSGTSMAAPHVSGLAAILWGIPGNGPTNIRTIIESTAQDLGVPGWDEYFGYGLIQMDAAIQQAQPPDTATPSITPTETQTAFPTSNVPMEEAQPALSPLQVGSSLRPFTPLPSTLTPDTIFSPTAAAETEEVTILHEKTATPAAEFAQTYEGYITPCGGFLLILWGVLLFWSTRKKKSHWKQKRIRL